MRTFTWPAQVGAAKQSQFRVGQNDFGDGYTQLYSTGINPRARTWNVVILDENYNVEIERFLDDHKGIYPFLWTPPGLSSPVPVTCQNYATNYLGMEVAQTSFTFTEAHLPETGVL